MDTVGAIIATDVIGMIVATAAATSPTAVRGSEVNATTMASVEGSAAMIEIFTIMVFVITVIVMMVISGVADTEAADSEAIRDTIGAAATTVITATEAIIGVVDITVTVGTMATVGIMTVEDIMMAADIMMGDITATEECRGSCLNEFCKYFSPQFGGFCDSLKHLVLAGEEYLPRPEYQTQDY